MVKNVNFYNGNKENTVNDVKYVKQSNFLKKKKKTGNPFGYLNGNKYKISKTVEMLTYTNGINVKNMFKL